MSFVLCFCFFEEDIVICRARFDSEEVHEFIDSNYEYRNANYKRT